MTAHKFEWEEELIMLIPCWRCGSDNLTHENKDYSSISFMGIHCLDCGLFVETDAFSNKELDKAWNRRACEDAKDAEIEELKETYRLSLSYNVKIEDENTELGNELSQAQKRVKELEGAIDKVCGVPSKVIAITKGIKYVDECLADARQEMQQQDEYIKELSYILNKARGTK